MWFIKRALEYSESWEISLRDRFEDEGRKVSGHPENTAETLQLLKKLSLQGFNL